MMSPNEKKIEQLLTNYFRNEMPEAIRELPDSKVIRPQVETTVTRIAPQRRSFSAAIGLAAACCALAVIVIAVGNPFSDPNPKPSDVVDAKEGAAKVIPADDDPFTKKPVEMQNGTKFVKKIHVDPITGERTEILVPQLVPDPRIQIVPLDDEDEELTPEE